MEKTGWQLDQANINENLEQFRADIAWYQQRKPELLKLYEGKRIAILKGSVIDSADDLPVLAKRMRDTYGKRPIFMPIVTAERRAVRIPSRPKRVSSNDAIVS